MSDNKIKLLIGFLLLTVMSFGQVKNQSATEKFIFSQGHNGSALELNGNNTYTLSATACTSNCKQSGKWIASSDTIKLLSPLTTQGGDECLLYYEVYSVLIRKDNKLFIINTDAALKDKLFYVKVKAGKANKSLEERRE